MLEIIILWHFCKKIGLLARQRDRRAIGYQLLLIGMWFGMEMIGAVAGFTISGGNPGIAYLFAVGGAVGGLIAAMMIAKSRTTAVAPQGFMVTPIPPAAPDAQANP